MESTELFLYASFPPESLIARDSASSSAPILIGAAAGRAWIPKACDFAEFGGSALGKGEDNRHVSASGSWLRASGAAPARLSAPAAGVWHGLRRLRLP